jgi:hypothetical protein
MCFRRTKNIYYVCRGEKYFIVKCYTDTSFVTWYKLSLSQFWLCVEGSQCNGRNFHDGFGWVPKLRHCDGLYM